MNLKELIKEVEKLNETLTLTNTGFAETERNRIKQTVEAVDKIKNWHGSTICRLMDSDSLEDWQKLKKLLELK